MSANEHFDLFPYMWLGFVATFSIVNLVWAFYEYRRGVARWGWSGARYERSEEPFYYWLSVGGRFLGFIFGCGMFWMGLDMLNWPH
jgi:hypothetical protein